MSTTIFNVKINENSPYWATNTDHVQGPVQCLEPRLLTQGAEIKQSKLR